MPGAKQVLRRFENGVMAGDTIAAVGEAVEGEPLLAPAMRGGVPVLDESLEAIAARSAAQLAALPARLRRLGPGTEPEPYPVVLLAAALERPRRLSSPPLGEERVEQRRRLVGERGRRRPAAGG